MQFSNDTPLTFTDAFDDLNSITLPFPLLRTIELMFVSLTDTDPFSILIRALDDSITAFTLTDTNLTLPLPILTTDTE